MPLDVQIENRLKGCKLILLAGTLDTNTVSQLSNAIAESVEDDDHTVIFDMKDLVFISSAGLRLFFKLNKDLRARKGNLLLLSLQPQVRKVFVLISEEDNIQKFATVEELDEYLLSIQKRIVDEN